ncbi:putative polyamine transporter [Cucumis melo var. makuwa]|uniref:Putative polyamine transporter n=1 Tax=Cucumis melo var. makuwa TaxID=1194695 RepID=A0A5D3DR75_CUCMM|nr:putative polyamine transporter [Cucumis melo var. makuwa]
MKTHQQEPPVSASQIHSVELDQKVFQPHSIPSAAASPHRNGAKEEPPIVSVSDSDHQPFNAVNPLYTDYRRQPGCRSTPSTPTSSSPSTQYRTPSTEVYFSGCFPPLSLFLFCVVGCVPLPLLFLNEKDLKKMMNLIAEVPLKLTYNSTPI